MDMTDVRHRRSRPGILKRCLCLPSRYNLRPEDARARLDDIEWSCENEIPDEVLDEVAFTLVAVGLLTIFPNTQNLFAALPENPSIAEDTSPSTPLPGDDDDMTRVARPARSHGQSAAPRGVDASIALQEADELDRGLRPGDREQANTGRPHGRRASPGPFRSLAERTEEVGAPGKKVAFKEEACEGRNAAKPRQAKSAAGAAGSSAAIAQRNDELHQPIRLTVLLRPPLPPPLMDVRAR